MTGPSALIKSVAQEDHSGGVEGSVEEDFNERRRQKHKRHHIDCKYGPLCCFFFYLLLTKLRLQEHGN